MRHTYKVEFLFSSGDWLLAEGAAPEYDDFEKANAAMNELLCYAKKGDKFRITLKEVTEKVVLVRVATDVKHCLVCDGVYFDTGNRTEGCPYCGNSDAVKTSLIAKSQRSS